VCMYDVLRRAKVPLYSQRPGSWRSGVGIMQPRYIYAVCVRGTHCFDIQIVPGPGFRKLYPRGKANEDRIENAISSRSYECVATAYIYIYTVIRNMYIYLYCYSIYIYIYIWYGYWVYTIIICVYREVIYFVRIRP